MIQISITPFQPMRSTFRSTIEDIRSQVKESGSSLTKLPSPERAQMLHDWLKRKLPKHLDVWIIEAEGRINEVNVYTITKGRVPSKVDSPRDDDWSNSGTTKATKMPTKVKKWIRDSF